MLNEDLFEEKDKEILKLKALIERFKKYDSNRKQYYADVLVELGQLRTYVSELEDTDKLILLTAHRRENLGEPMRHIFRAVKRIVEEYPDVKVVYPIHLNPKVREVANEVFEGIDRVRLIEPLEVIDFHNFQNKSYIILTDSGGIQEEAPSLGKPVLVLRDTTERPLKLNTKERVYMMYLI